MQSAKAITAMGKNGGHRAWVCATDATRLFDEITSELMKSFDEVGKVSVSRGYNGWPLGPNQMFCDASAQMSGREQPFFFWEPDCVPMKRGWLDDLQADYNKKPGIIGHMYQGGVASNGKNIYKMIVGNAIYPPSFLEYCPAAASLFSYNLAYRNSGNEPEPWDVRCRYNFMAIGRDTPLIRTYWKSVSYRWMDGKVVFFAADPDAQAIQQVTCPDRTISSDAVVIHGCKDGSLHAMALEGFLEPAKAIAEPVVEPAPAPEAKIEASATGYTTLDSVRKIDEISPSEKIEIQYMVKSLKKTKPKGKRGRPRKKMDLSDDERERRRQRILEVMAKKRERADKKSV